MDDQDKAAGKTPAQKEITRRIDDLLAGEPAERPTITVVGDEAVTSINLPKRRRPAPR